MRGSKHSVDNLHACPLLTFVRRQQPRTFYPSKQATNTTNTLPTKTINNNTVKMASKLPASLQASEEDYQMMLAAQVHLGTKNCDKTMEPYVYKRRADGEWTFTRCTADGWMVDWSGRAALGRPCVPGTCRKGGGNIWNAGRAREHSSGPAIKPRDLARTRQLTPCPGIHVLNIGKTWEKLVFAARILATIENPHDIAVISARPYGHRAVLKMAGFTGAQPIAGRFTPGNFTNYITKSFKEPRVIVVTDPRVDHQAIREAAYVNIPYVPCPLQSTCVVEPALMHTQGHCLL